MTQPVTDPNAPVAPVAGSDEYNTAMAAKFKAGHGSPDEGLETIPLPPMPEGGAEKFYNAETGVYDWQNHAKEVEYRLSQAAPVVPETKVDPKPGDAEANNEVSSIVTAAGLDPNALETAIDTGVGLTEDQYTALSKVGVSKQLVDQFIEGRKAQMTNLQNEAYNYAGGQEEWNGLVEWAATSLPAEKLEAVQRQLQGADWQLAIDHLKTVKASSSPTAGEPRSLLSGASGAGSSSGYTSRAQMKADMANPQYQKDSSFRAQVAAKMKHASWIDDK